MSWPSDLQALRRNSILANTNYVATLGDFTVRANAVAGPVTIGLPPAGPAFGQLLVIKKIDASANQVIIDPSGAELIDGGATVSITTQYDTKIIQSNGTSWDVLNVGGT